MAPSHLRLELGSQSALILQMPLLTHPIRLYEPFPEFLVDLAQIAQSKRVNMISRRKGFDLPESGTIQSTRQHHVPV